MPTGIDLKFNVLKLSELDENRESRSELSSESLCTGFPTIV